MEYRSIRGIDEPLSVVGLGCWPFGGRHWGDDGSPEQWIRTVHAALELGVNWFDTAPLYGEGAADRILARALGSRSERGRTRGGCSEVHIATKVGVRYGGGGHPYSDLSSAFVRKDCEDSLNRLGVERIGLLQVHWPCEQGTPLEETLETLHSLKEEGKIAAFGLCNYGSEPLAEALRLGASSFQLPFSMVRREFATVFDQAGSGDSPLRGMAYETLCRGLLTGKFSSLPRFPKTDMRRQDRRFWGVHFYQWKRWFQRVRQTAEEWELPASALAIAWVLSQPGANFAVVGAKSSLQVSENVRAAEILGDPKRLVFLQSLVNEYLGS